MAKTIKTRIQNKHDLEVNWLQATFVPLEGELIIYDSEIDPATGKAYTNSEGKALLPVLLNPDYRSTPIDYQRFKIGDGKRRVNSLPFYEEALKEHAATLVDGVAKDLDNLSLLVEKLPKFKLEIVAGNSPEAVPADKRNAETVYLVSNSYSSGSNVYTEYIYIPGDTNNPGRWEILGEQKLDLSGYATKEYVDNNFYTIDSMNTTLTDITNSINNAVTTSNEHTDDLEERLSDPNRDDVITVVNATNAINADNATIAECAKGDTKSISETYLKIEDANAIYEPIAEAQLSHKAINDYINEINVTLSNDIKLREATLNNKIEKIDLNFTILEELSKQFIVRYENTPFNKIKEAYDNGRTVVLYIKEPLNDNQFGYLTSITDDTAIFRGQGPNGDIEYICNNNGQGIPIWDTRNIQTIQIGDAVFKYDYDNARIVVSFCDENGGAVG
jgi:predicted DNA-binding ArsR family transcriptional regulator